jgi:hypothetical protein
MVAHRSRNGDACVDDSDGDHDGKVFTRDSDFDYETSQPHSHLLHVSTLPQRARPEMMGARCPHRPIQRLQIIDK